MKLPPNSRLTPVRHVRRLGGLGLPGQLRGLQSAGWLVEHLLDMEHADRAMRPFATRCTVPSSPYTGTWLGLNSSTPKWEQG